MSGVTYTPLLIFSLFLFLSFYPFNIFLVKKVGEALKNSLHEKKPLPLFTFLRFWYLLLIYFLLFQFLNCSSLYSYSLSFILIHLNHSYSLSFIRLTYFFYFLFHFRDSVDIFQFQLRSLITWLDNFCTR